MLLATLLQVGGLVTLPLLEVADGFHRGLLPGRGAGVVVNVVDTPPLVLPPLPAA